MRTQAAASLAIHWARYMACTCNRNERDDVSDDWVEVALYLNLPYDNVRRLHYGHKGYMSGTYSHVYNVFFITQSRKNHLYIHVCILNMNNLGMSTSMIECKNTAIY